MKIPLEMRNNVDLLHAFFQDKTPRQMSSFVESAAIENDVDTIKIVLNYAPPNCDRSLFYAASQGYTEALNILLPHADPLANESEAFRVACQFGFLEVVKILLPLSDPQCNHNHPLRAAASNGHIDVVRYILPFTNPMDISSAALQGAAYNGHWDVVDLLYDVSDLSAVKKDLDRVDSQSWIKLENEMHARRQKIRINEELPGKTNSARTKKM